MIHYKYDRENNSTVIHVDDLSLIGCDFVVVKFINIITNEVHYETKLHSNMWTTWNGAELITDVEVYNDKDVLLKLFRWDVTINGDPIEKILWYYLYERNKSGIPSHGLVIGTHDGRNGHWIYPVIENLTRATLIEGGEKQFQKLKQNYWTYNNVNMLCEIVTPEGGPVYWYEGGEGYTDTVVPELISGWVEPSQISKSYKKSSSIKTISKVKEFDWLHLDVEGIDDQLIVALDIRPNIIIYESMNLEESKQKKLDEWFLMNSYKTLTSLGNTIAIKIN